MNKERNMAIVVYLGCAVIFALCMWGAAAYAPKEEVSEAEISGYGYSYTDEDGAKHIVETTTSWTKANTATTTTAVKGEKYTYREAVPLSQELQGHIYSECRDRDVPTAIVYAVIERESNFDEDAISESGDYGLMQINEICHEEMCARLGVPNVVDAYYNTMAGIALLSEYYHKYDDWNASLMCYNCGEFGANRLFEQGEYTSLYADEVLKMAQKYGFEVDM